MTYSAFGVDHYGQEISKRAESRLATKVVPLAQQGAARVASATRSVIGDPKNAHLTVGQAARPIGEKLSADSPYHGALSTLRSIRSRAKGIQAGNQGYSNVGATREALKGVTLGDVHRAANVRRTVHSPENLLRGKKTTTSDTNVLTGESGRHVNREGNRFLKPLESNTVNGTTTKVKGKEGGLTGQGKTAALGVPAAAGLGGIAYSEKKRNGSAGY